MADVRYVQKRTSWQRGFGDPFLLNHRSDSIDGPAVARKAL
jgi:hypothetical protein